MNVSLLPAAAVAVPALGAVMVALTGRWPNLREAVTLVTASVLFALVASMLPEVRAGTYPVMTLVEPLPDLPIGFRVDALGLLFALIASGLWIVTSIYAIGYMRAHEEAHQTRFYAAFAVALAAAMGVAFAANMLTLFVFYEVLTLSTYPLVVHAGTEDAKRGGRVYLGWLLATSIGLQLPAIVGTWLIAGGLEFRAGGLFADASPGWLVGLLLALYVFGIGKAAVMPVHRWLPAAMVAPTPVSALLHAVAVVKAGVFTILKVAVFLFGLDVIAGLGAQQLLLYVAAATILLASLVALRQDNLKRRLAYSTVSQLGYIVLGALLANELGALGGAAHIVTHAFGKITLFFAAGAILVGAHKTEVSELSGLGRHMPLTFGFFTIASLSIIGLPPFAGFWSKWYLVLGSVKAAEWVAVAVLLASSLLNIAYLLSIPARAFFAPAPAHAHDHAHEAPWPCLLAMGATAAGCIAWFFAPEALLTLPQAMLAQSWR